MTHDSYYTWCWRSNYKSRSYISHRSTVGKLYSHNIMVYYTLKSFLADGGCSCTSSHPAAVLKGQKGLSHSTQTALNIAYHLCELALWWLHHTDCGVWGIDSSTPNLVGRTSLTTPCVILFAICMCFSCYHWFNIVPDALSPLTGMNATINIWNSTTFP